MYINPREVSADAFAEIVYEGAYNNEALRRCLKRNGAMDKRDKALVTEMVNGTLRNLIFIDYVINSFSKITTEKMKPWILTVLRLGVYQILFMDRVPDSAACDEAVKLAASRGFKSLKGFVNGVLRNISRNKLNLPMPDINNNKMEYISIKYSFPLWVVKMWSAMYGADKTEKLCAASNAAPDMTITCNTLKISPDDLKAELEKNGISVTPSKYFEESFSVRKTDDITLTDAFKNGLFHVQDESSLLAVKVLNPQKHDRVADVCAAPGGKSFTIAEKMENKGYILSGDIYEHKTELINDGAKRLGINIIDAVTQDAAKIEGKADFDCVLVDAPCSGLGLIRKKPDIKFTKTGSDIDSLTDIQRKVLSAAAGMVKKGGVLVYSTCTVCRKENTGSIKWFKESFGFESDDITEYLPKNMACETAKNGYIELLPSVQGTDGFFIARLIKKGE